MGVGGWKMTKAKRQGWGGFWINRLDGILAAGRRGRSAIAGRMGGAEGFDQISRMIRDQW